MKVRYYATLNAFQFTTTTLDRNGDPYPEVWFPTGIEEHLFERDEEGYTLLKSGEPVFRDGPLSLQKAAAKKNRQGNTHIRQAAFNVLSAILGGMTDRGLPWLEDRTEACFVVTWDDPTFNFELIRTPYVVPE